MKKLTALLLAALMVVSLAACGGNNSGNNAGGNQPSGSQPNNNASQPNNNQTGANEPTQDPITLRIGYMPNYASMWAVMTGINHGEFAEEGITIELTSFQDGPSEIAAMEGGSLDLAYIGKGAHRLCILGSAIIFAPSSVHTTDKVIVTAASGVQDMSGLAGKKIGYNPGSSSETTLDNALTYAGLTRDDVTLNALDPDYMVAAMLSGDLDACVTWNPYSNQILTALDGSFEIEFSDGSTNMSSWICLPSYAAANRDTLIRFSRALYKAMDWGSNPDNADQVAQWCATETKTDKAAMLAQWGDATWFDIATMKAGIADGSIQKYYEGVQNDMLQAGSIEQSDVKDVSQWVMLDVMQEALNQVG